MLSIFNYQGNTVRFRVDGWGSLTDMAKATGKRVNNWTQTATATEYLEELSAITGIPVIGLLESKPGGKDVPEHSRGTWGHPKVCIRFAQWCSAKFAVWVDFKVDELLQTGHTKVADEPQSKPFDRSALPPADVRLKDLKESLEFFGIDHNNPRFNQHIQDFVTNEILAVEENKALPSADRQKWLGVVEKAERMGYPIGEVNRYRSALGRYVSKYYSHIDRRREPRLCNGTMREIWVYLNCQTLNEAVSSYLNSKNIFVTG